jgi:type I restriction enzyme S subunit
MDGDRSYRRVTVKRRHGGIELRDVQLGADIKVKNQFLIKAGDFLISERQIVHGACGIVPPELEGALVSNEYLVLKPCEGFDATYFNYLVQLLKYAKLFLRCSQGVDIEKFLFKPKDWLRKEIPVPPSLEQRKIAAILSAMDDKLDVIARQMDAVQALKRGLMQTLFRRGVGTKDATGRWVPHTEFKVSELGEIPAAWEIRSLESVANVERGKFSARPRNDPRYFEGGDIPFIQTGDIAGAARFIDKASQFLNDKGLGVSKLFKPGTIFLTIAANIGDVAIAARPMACPDSVVGINSIEGVCNNTWLYYLLNVSKDYFDSRATQNAQKNINLQVLRPFLFALPSMPEQQRIADVLTAVDDKLNVLSSNRTHYKTLKHGLMQKLLTGEWRVKLDVVPATG